MSLIRINLQLNELQKILEELSVKEQRTYKIALGKTVASSLAGFIVGLIVGVIITATYFKSLEILKIPAGF